MHVNRIVNPTSKLGSLTNTSAAPVRWEDLAEGDSGSDWEGLANDVDEADQVKQTEHDSSVINTPRVDLNGNQDQIEKQKLLGGDPEYLFNDSTQKAAMVLEDGVQGDDVEEWEALAD